MSSAQHLRCRWRMHGFRDHAAREPLTFNTVFEEIFRIIFMKSIYANPIYVYQSYYQTQWILGVDSVRSGMLVAYLSSMKISHVENMFRERMKPQQEHIEAHTWKHILHSFRNPLLL